MIKKYNIVYKTTNIINNKIYVGVDSTNNLNYGYIGSGMYRQSCAERLVKTSNSLLAKAVCKYGYINFKTEVISFHNTKKEAFKEEECIVDKDWVNCDLNYNLVLGGPGRKGFIMTDKNKKNLINLHSKEYVVVDTLNNKTYFIKNLIKWARENFKDELYEENTSKYSTKSKGRCKLTPTKLGNTSLFKNRWFICYKSQWIGKVNLRKRKKPKSNKGYKKNINTLIHKNIKLKNKKGKIYEVKNIYDFCKKQNIDYSNLLKVIKKKNKTTKGWSLC